MFAEENVNEKESCDKIKTEVNLRQKRGGLKMFLYGYLFGVTLPVLPASTVKT